METKHLWFQKRDIKSIILAAKEGLDSKDTQSDEKDLY